MRLTLWASRMLAQKAAFHVSRFDLITRVSLSSSRTVDVCSTLVRWLAWNGIGETLPHLLGSPSKRFLFCADSISVDYKWLTKPTVCYLILLNHTTYIQWLASRQSRPVPTCIPGVVTLLKLRPPTYLTQLTKPLASGSWFQIKREDPPSTPLPFIWLPIPILG